MVNKFIKYLFLLIFVISCSGGGDSPTNSIEDNGNQENSLDFPDANDYGGTGRVEVVTWNIRQFPQHSTTINYVKALLEKWNADIYFLQEINSESSLREMVNLMPDYSYVLDDESGNLGFALVYKNDFITFNSKNELWANTPNNDDGDADYENNASYQFADRPPMENYLTWSDGNESIDFYLIGVHYKCCGDDSYNVNATGDETTRRHHASLLLTDYVINNRPDDNVIILGDFNNVGAQTISNPTLSPFTDQNNFNSAASFRLTDLNTLNGSSSGYSWQGWTSSYSAAHLDHIIINDEMFRYADGNDASVISLPDQTGISTTNISNRISDHQPVLWSFSP